MKIINFEKIASTNTYAKENLDQIEDKTVITADKQTQGRGRFKRVWTDLGADNIFASIILKPSEKFLPVYANLTQYLSLSICKIFEKYGVKPEVKWPNDILINGKKITGILCETVMRGEKFKGLVLGFGINLNASLKSVLEIDRPATALNLEIGGAVKKQEFLEKILEQFFAEYETFLNDGFPMIRKEYISKTKIIGKNVNVSVWNDVFEGHVKDIDNQGNLILELQNGEIKT